MKTSKTTKVLRFGAVGVRVSWAADMAFTTYTLPIVLGRELVKLQDAGAIEFSKQNEKGN